MAEQRAVCGAHDPAAGLDLLTCGPLTFAAPDMDTYPCLKLAMNAAYIGGTACAVLNGANEEAVAAYLRDEIGFYDISDSIAYAMAKVPVVQNPSLEQILEADRLARQAAKQYFSKKVM